MTQTLEQHLTEKLKLNSQSGESFLMEMAKNYAKTSVQAEAEGDGNKANQYAMMAVATETTTTIADYKNEDFVLQPIPQEVQHEFFFPFIKEFYQSKGIKFRENESSYACDIPQLNFRTDDYSRCVSVTMSLYEIDHEKPDLGKKLRVSVFNPN